MILNSNAARYSLIAVSVIVAVMIVYFSVSDTSPEPAALAVSTRPIDPSEQKEIEAVQKMAEDALKKGVEGLAKEPQKNHPNNSTQKPSAALVMPKAVTNLPATPGVPKVLPKIPPVAIVPKALPKPGFGIGNGIVKGLIGLAKLTAEIMNESQEMEARLRAAENSRVLKPEDKAQIPPITAPAPR